MSRGSYELHADHPDYWPVHSLLESGTPHELRVRRRSDLIIQVNDAMGAPLEVPVPVFEVDDLDARRGELGDDREEELVLLVDQRANPVGDGPEHLRGQAPTSGDCRQRRPQPGQPSCLDAVNRLQRASRHPRDQTCSGQAILADRAQIPCFATASQQAFEMSSTGRMMTWLRTPTRPFSRL